MASVKDTASFFTHGNSKQFDYVLKLYPTVLRMKAETRTKKPEDLIKLDDWYQNELPRRIKQRGKDAHLVHEELVQAMKWKQSRGKFYPQLSYLIKVNTPRAVMQETKKAFRKLPNLKEALTALSNLKGVGTTMASALLAAAAPDSAPFMADECLMAIPEIEGIDYTTKEYLNFVTHIQTTVARLNNETTDAGGLCWSAHRVELAIWTHYVANELQPQLLDDLPMSSAGLTVGPVVSSSIVSSGHDDDDATPADEDEDDDEEDDEDEDDDDDEVTEEDIERRRRINEGTYRRPIHMIDDSSSLSSGSLVLAEPDGEGVECMVDGQLVCNGEAMDGHREALAKPSNGHGLLPVDVDGGFAAGRLTAIAAGDSESSSCSIGPTSVDLVVDNINASMKPIRKLLRRTNPDPVDCESDSLSSADSDLILIGAPPPKRNDDGSSSSLSADTTSASTLAGPEAAAEQPPDADEPAAKRARSISCAGDAVVSPAGCPSAATTGAIDSTADDC